jgi:hypothetical protein
MEDSLCIVQNSKYDWLKESVQQVYSNTVLNIAASAAHEYVFGADDVVEFLRVKQLLSTSLS